MHRFKFLALLGEGSYGEVYKVRRLADNLHYAFKKVSTRNLSQKQIENTLNYIRILASLDHPNIIGYKYAFFDEQEQCICIVMELADGGDLKSLVRARKRMSCRLYEDEIWRLALDIIKGLIVLQSKNIMHRDIKAANVLLSNGRAKLADLNVCKITKTDYAYSQAGTPYYTSPEIWREEPYSYKSDVWSLGCLLYELCCLKQPFRTNYGMRDLAEKVQKGKYDPLPYVYSHSLRNFVSSCLVVDVYYRANLETLEYFACLFATVMPTKQKWTYSLLSTIVVPHSIEYLNDVLPSPKYHSKSVKKMQKLAFLKQSPYRNKGKSSHKIQSARFLPSPEKKLTKNISAPQYYPPKTPRRNLNF